MFVLFGTKVVLHVNSLSPQASFSFNVLLVWLPKFALVLCLDVQHRKVDPHMESASNPLDTVQGSPRCPRIETLQSGSS